MRRIILIAAVFTVMALMPATGIAHDPSAEPHGSQMEKLDAAETFKPGDVVKLKSGGPKMTVTATDLLYAYCAWFHDGEARSSAFPFVALEHHRSSRRR